MKRLLLLGAIAAGLLVPAATAAPTTTGTLRGTVVAKDRAHHALVVARAGGRVQMLVAPAAFSRTGIGRTVVIRYSAAAGRLPLALTVSLEGRARTAVVQGTIVRLARRQAIINAGGSLLKVTLKAPKARRTLAVANSGPGVGDSIKVEVEIEDDGSLDAGKVLATGATAGASAGSDGELEVRGTVSVLTPATAGTPGLVTVLVRGLPVSCAIPAGVTLDVNVGELIELECRLTGDPAAWTVRGAESEDENDDEDSEGSGSGNAGPSGSGSSGKIEVRGTITAAFVPSSALVTVTPKGGGADVACAIVPGSLSRFAAGDSVRMECVEVGDTLKLKEIEKADGEHAGDDDDGDDHGQDDNDDDGGDDGED